MAPRTSRGEVRQFISVVNYYHDMWARRSHTLAMLTNIPYIKVKFIWTKAEEDAFYKIKRIVANNTLFAYPDFNEGFKIHTHARKFQPGGFISHNSTLISFHSITLTNAHKMYTVIEK